MLSRLFLKIPQRFLDTYNKQSTVTNFNRMLIASGVILLIQVYNLFMSLMTPFTNEPIILRGYYTFYGATIAANILLLLLGHLVKFKDQKLRFYGVFTLLLAYYHIFWAVGIAIADQFQHEEIVVYYIVVFVYAIILDVQTPRFTAILSVNHLMFMGLLNIIRSSTVLSSTVLTSSTQIVGFAIIIRAYLHELTKRNFVQNQQLMELNTNLEYISQFDTLSGVYNRNTWERLYTSAFANAIDLQTNLGVILLDIDYFKEYNDHYGHVAGDDVIRQVGKTLHDLADKYHGQAGRFGGDEFIILFIDTDSHQLASFTDKLTLTIRDLAMAHEKSMTSDQVTISSGYHIITPREGDDIWTGVSKADQVLYMQKSTRKERRI